MTCCSSNVTKRRLDNAIMYRNGYRNGELSDYNSLTWDIPRPSALRGNIVHKNQIAEINVSCVRKKKSFTFWMTSSYAFYNVEYSIVLDGCLRLPFCRAQIICDGNHKMEGRNILCKYEKKCPKKSYLQLVIKFDRRYLRRIRPNTASNTMKEQSQYFSIETSLKLSRSLHLSDFVLRLDQKAIPAHKAILAARSVHFRDFIETNFRHNGEMITMRLDSSLDTCISVFHFLYWGQLLIKDTDSAIRILELATKLDMPTLGVLCSLWLMRNLNTDNVCRIRNAAIKTGMEALKNTVDHFHRVHGIQF